MAELVRAGARGHGLLADEGAVGRSHAFGHAYHDGVLPAQKILDALHQRILVKRDLGEEDQVGPARAARPRKGGGSGRASRRRAP